VLDHAVIGVADLERSRGFYEQALAPLGVTVMYARPERIGLGDTRLFFFLSTEIPASGPLHLAFGAPDRAAVDAFHAAALAAGAANNGGPGPRPQYHASYYGAFVIDPDGNNVEAVCHRPEPAA
jgi:catechol 2,3-dioxygenase-like lactoylglutathione lyase family enzyme